MAQSFEYKTTLDMFQDALGGKWKLFIVSRLVNRPKRPSQLKTELPGISQRVLTKELKELVEDDILQRTVFAEMPPHVEYGLTDYGRTVLPILEALCSWGLTHVHRKIENGNEHLKLVEDGADLQQFGQIAIKRAVRLDNGAAQ